MREPGETVTTELGVLPMSLREVFVALTLVMLGSLSACH